MGGGGPIAKVGPSNKVRRFEANLRIRIAVGQDILHCPSPTLRRHWHNATKAARVPLVAFVARSQREPKKKWHWRFEALGVKLLYVLTPKLRLVKVHVN